MALATSSTSRQSGCILDDVRHDINRFLDPSVLSLTRSQMRGRSREADAAECMEEQGESSSQREEDSSAKGRSSMDLLKLRCDKESLQAELEDARQEAEELMSRREREVGRDAAAIMRLTQERDELRQDSRAKKRRLSEVEDELLRLQVERDTLAKNFEELTESSQRQLEALQQKASAESRKYEEELAALRQDLASARTQREQSNVTAADAESSAILKARVAELEAEVCSLRMALKEASPEKDLASQLRARHAEYEKELQESRRSLEELHSVRGLSLQLEQEVVSLKAALTVRDKALREAEHAAEGADSMRRDLAAFVSAAAEIVASARQTCAGAEAAKMPAGESPSPLDLSLAWSRLQAQGSKKALKASENQQQLDETAVRERQLQADVRKLRVDLSALEADSQELRLNLRHARDENEALRARESVLREALAGNSKESSATVGPASADAAAASETLKQRQRDLEELLASKSQALSSASKEVETLRAEVSNLAATEVKAQRLERVNAELWQANKDLESRASQLERQQEEAADADYDRRSTKILHLAQGPSGRAATGGLSNEKSGQSGPLERSGDLEQQQAARQLERFKKATKKYVQDFREGIYSLLGWKIEMKGEGSNMRWHLMSRYQEGQELVFQLQPSRAGRPAEFDLLGTPWAEQLQGDRQAMAYLQIYSSIPGFLAHVTTDLLSQQTFNR
eukprot:gb/GFBE01035845.1/.p1 GENE.gb/GFBE01035845.1/~~gb/GFBE01035845.1/.p1  ORF type:complete len:694 (+),score=203.54 gb/GFBE01035845.1/:1-2082(+)